jgi:hypothetical protein
MMSTLMPSACTLKFDLPAALTFDLHPKKDWQIERMQTLWMLRKGSGVGCKRLDLQVPQTQILLHDVGCETDLGGFHEHVWSV